MEEKKLILLFGAIVIVLSTFMFGTYAAFSGSHTVYTNKTTAEAFCEKCHADKVATVNASVHKNAGCICHGYNPNISGIYDINLVHNLTKQIYCTNCHTNYSLTTGDIVIHNDGGDISGINQSAHYIIASSTNKTPVYDRAEQFFSNKSR